MTTSESNPSIDPGQSDTAPTVLDLLTLAERLRGMPPVEPDSAWMEASKERLLARFDAAHSRSGRDPAESAPDAP